MDVLVVYLSIFLRILSASGECVDESPLPPVVPPTTWTGWFSVDDPSDGTDDETLAAVRLVSPSLCTSPTDTQCRVKYINTASDAAGQVLAPACTSDAGLMCRNTDQPDQETCLDYEIRFLCPTPDDALPDPHFFWDMSTKTSADADEPFTCLANGTVSSIYPNLGGMAGTVNGGRLSVTDSYDSSDHLCALRRTDDGGVILYGEAKDRCIANTACCTSGWTITFWMRYRSGANSGTKYILSTGGQATTSSGLSIHATRKFSLFVRGNTDHRAWEMRMAEQNKFPPSQWTHHCFTYHPAQGTSYYRNGDLIDSLLSETRTDGDYHNEFNDVTMFTQNANGINVYKPRCDLSDFKMFYRAFSSAEVAKSYRKETTESNLVIHYLRRLTDDESYDVVLECLAKAGSNPHITWYRSDDGAHFQLVSPSSEVDIIESLPNNFRRKSVLKVGHLSSTVDAVFACEASSVVMHGVSVSKTIVIPPTHTEMGVEAGWINATFNAPANSYFLECAVYYTNTAPSLIWIRPNGNQLTQSTDRFQVDNTHLIGVAKNTVISVLTVEDYDFEQDDGRYECSASLPAFGHAVSLTIKTQYAYRGQLEANAVSLVPGQPIRLTCRADDVDQVYQADWLRVSGYGQVHLTNDKDHTIHEERKDGKFLSYLDIGPFAAPEYYVCSINHGSAEATVTISGPRESPRVVPPTTWTSWFSVDDPSDGTDNETLAAIGKLYPSVCKSPTRAECRVRFLHDDLSNTSQTLANSCTPNGLLCQNSDQVNRETCLDYEIRFDCPSPSDALPEPNIFWDFSTKQFIDDDEPLNCDGKVTTIYPNIGGLAGIVNSGTLEAIDGFDSSDHLCAIRRSEPQSAGRIRFGDASGKCISEPQCCTSGFSIAFWMRYLNIPTSNTRYIFSTGGHTAVARGVSIHLTRKFSLFVRGDTTRKAWMMKMADASTFPSVNWTHHCFTYDPVQGTRYYKNSVFLHSLTTHTSIDDPYTNDFNEVMMFSANNEATFYKPKVDVSDMKIFYQAFNGNEVQKLYLKETSESNLVIHYLRMHSHGDSFGVELECLAKSGSQPNITWFRSDDGYHFHLISPSSEVAIYDSFPNSYRRRSVLMVRGLNFSTDVIFVCEASDIVRGGAVSKFVTIPKRDMYWTPWLSADEPSDGQDRETLTDHQQAFDLLCDNPTDIQCRTLFSDIPSFESGQIFVTNCTASSGFVCVGADQNSIGNSSCYDYAVRYSCPQSKFRWTSWYDISHPSGLMEDESFNTHALQNYTDFCSHPIGAECRIKGTNECLIASGVVPDVPFLCNANGFLCRDANNEKSCPDFEVRYRCPDLSGTDLRINQIWRVDDHIDSTLKMKCKATMGVHTDVGFSLEWAWFESHQQPPNVKQLAQSELVTISSNTKGTCCKESLLEIKDFYSSLVANKTIVCIGRDGITVDYQTFHVDIEERSPISVPEEVTASYPTVVDDVQSDGTASSGINIQHTSTVAKLHCVKNRVSEYGNLHQ